VKSYRIILADDHTLFRRGMRKLLQEMPGVEVIGEVHNGLELLELLKRLSPDLVILDISMPGLSGIETTREIRSLYPLTKVLILTMHKSKEYLYHAVTAGASGYLLKEDSDDELFSAIQTIRNEGTYVTRNLIGALVEDLSRGPKRKGSAASDPLTTREREILKLIAEGKTNGEIAILLHVSIRTVENHRASIMNKLNLRNVAGLVRYAIHNGLV
jgi:DNA-binding NarL/FixJ family response regulator